MTKRYTVNTDPRLRRPLQVLRFYEARTNEDIVTTALLCFLENEFDELLSEMKEHNPAELRKEDIGTVKQTYREVQKMWKDLWK